MASLNGGIIGVDNPVQQQAEQITTFTSTGTLTTQPLTTQIQYVIVAGGGAGAGGIGGGGGAGGYRSSVPGESSGGGASAESLAPVSGASPYPVVIGAGGTKGASESTKGTPGSPSSVAGVTSTGGGLGGSMAVSQPIAFAEPGGSGGGGNLRAPFPNGGSGTANQGYPGQTGAQIGPPSSIIFYGSGGGGGAAEAGQGLSPTTPPTGPFQHDGGDGVASSITGSPVTRAGGGGGGMYQNYPGNIQGLGGAGGGGNGNATPGVPGGVPGSDGTTNTGGGGGGGSGNNGLGGNGGSGVVIVKEPALTIASGMWSMEAVYDNVKAGNWTNA